MRFTIFRVAIGFLLAALFQGCSSSGLSPLPPPARAMEVSLGRTPASLISADGLMREINVKKEMIPRGRYGRRRDRPIDPRYITIHSTQNYSGDAWRHALALQHGKLRGGKYGYLCWHFTVQEDVVLQHLPTTQRGEHADYDGPGNQYSIGIEMCEHRGNSRAQTVERTAMLTASLMDAHNIPLSHVVPHYHWPRPKTSTPHKNCPHFLLENGKPGRTWKWFLGRVKLHFERIAPPEDIPLAVAEKPGFEEGDPRPGAVYETSTAVMSVPDAPESSVGRP